MQQILLIEDDANLQYLIAHALSREYQISQASSLNQAYQLLDEKQFDLVLVDRILPDGDALEIISYLHDSHYTTKVIALSQLFSVSERIRGLENGADDYLGKPFSLGELRLKITKALLYEKRKNQDIYSVQNLTFNPQSGVVKIKDDQVRLRRREAQILACLFRYKNRTVTREMLIDEVWSLKDVVPTQTTLDVYIRRIRLLLKDYGKLIVTRRGFGYSLLSA